MSDPTLSRTAAYRLSVKGLILNGVTVAQVILGLEKLTLDELVDYLINTCKIQPENLWKAKERTKENLLIAIQQALTQYFAELGGSMEWTVVDEDNDEGSAGNPLGVG